ncbi:MAG: tRNA guanosine(15) transglycosylase TgtA [Euryarchaeota archaeon]|nr:tRNA guanosine(15) transglycosylase TgtA [Euryarchaeota archaeon]
MVFEVLARDALGRLGRLETPHGRVETPLVMPVVRPSGSILPPGEMARLGAKMVITNAYLLHQNGERRERALREGVHGLLGWRGPVMTDSGAYQLAEYGRVEVSNREIVEFQEAIGSDLAVPLDVPTGPEATHEEAERDLGVTRGRLQEALAIRRRTLLVAPVQGALHLDLRERSAREARDTGAPVAAIGGVVPLLDSYRYEDLVEVVLASRRGLSRAMPVHLFGAGHPITMPLMAALGCDLFDSASYALYARDGRYITPRGTLRARDLPESPCPCPACQRAAPREMDEAGLAAHNLHVTLASMSEIRNAIREGALWDLVEQTCRGHPALLEGLRRALQHSEEMEPEWPAASRFLYRGSESSHRPEVLRHHHTLRHIPLPPRVLVTDKNPPHAPEPGGMLHLKPAFGPYPPELSETYPIGPSWTLEDPESRRMAIEGLRALVESHPGVQFTLEADPRWAEAIPEGLRGKMEVRPSNAGRRPSGDGGRGL